MSILRDFSPNQEMYSIDDSFLDLIDFKHKKLNDYRQAMRGRILQWTGLPVCVDIGATKTLSKLANHCAKKRKEFKSVCNLNTMPVKDLDDLLSQIDVGEIWGVGRKLAPKLQAMGFNTVLDLKRANPYRCMCSSPPAHINLMKRFTATPPRFFYRAQALTKDKW